MPAVGIGTSIFLIAAGAILRYAIEWQVSGIKIETVGLILMLVGIAGLIISLAVMFLGDRDRRADDYPTRRY